MTPRRDSNVVVSIDFPFDPAVERVVVIGNGIAGVTAADHVRRRHPDCAVDVVAAEPHPLYNRMGISRLIYGRSAMVGLHLLPDAWYDDNRITCWLNTRALADRPRRPARWCSAPASGSPFDRLILATGSEAYVPEIAGFGGRGHVRAAHGVGRARRPRVRPAGGRRRRAVVAGGGLLGLEAAYALHKLGLRTTVLERGRWLLRRQLDERAGELLRGYLANLGIEVLVEAETAALEDGSAVVADGGAPARGRRARRGGHRAVGRARAAGRARGRRAACSSTTTCAPRTSGSSPPATSPSGADSILGLWPVAVEQAEVAAENAVGGSRPYAGTVPVTMLKVVGVELLSIGAITGRDELVDEDAEALRYRKLVRTRTAARSAGSCSATRAGADAHGRGKGVAADGRVELSANVNCCWVGRLGGRRGRGTT